MILDLNSDKSIYLQIAEVIENEILIGNIIEGEQVPSTNQFAQILKINPATAAKGINMLVDEGILFKKRGIGMFVNEGAQMIILKKRQDTFLKESLPAILKEAQRLEITTEELINYISKYEGGKKL